MWFSPVVILAIGFIIGFIINLFIDVHPTNGLAIGVFISIILFGCFFYFVDTKIKIQEYSKLIKKFEFLLSNSE